METLINIIHPDMYRSTLAEDNEERDRKIARFLRNSLENGAKIFNYNQVANGLIHAGFISEGMRCDIFFGEILADERTEHFYTFKNGLPLKDKKPEEMDENIWKYLSNEMINCSRLTEKISSVHPSQTFFIGGFLEFCLVNFAHHYSANIASGEKMYVVPELCVSIKEDEAKKAREILESEKIKFIGYEEALKLVNNNS